MAFHDFPLNLCSILAYQINPLPRLPESMPTLDPFSKRADHYPRIIPQAVSVRYGPVYRRPLCPRRAHINIPIQFALSFPRFVSRTQLIGFSVAPIAWPMAKLLDD